MPTKWESLPHYTEDGFNNRCSSLQHAATQTGCIIHRDQRRTVKVGLQTLDKEMTFRQAVRYGERHIPAELSRAGFDVVVFTATIDINGWDGYRINFGKRC